MKSKTSMYHRPLAFVYALLVAVIFCGCGNETTKQNPTTSIHKIEYIDGHVIKNISLYVIDSCEYIGHISEYYSDFLTHKGNCKFCVERSKK